MQIHMGKRTEMPERTGTLWEEEDSLLGTSDLEITRLRSLSLDSRSRWEVKSRGQRSVAQVLQQGCDLHKGEAAPTV